MKVFLKSLLLITLVMTYSEAKEIAKVNGMAITEAEANKALQVLTSGKKSWAKLSKKEKQELIQMVAPAKVIVADAKKTLTKEEKDVALMNFWLQKNTSRVSVTESEAKKKYEDMKKVLAKTGNKKPIPPFEKLQPNIKMQIAKERVVGKLMQKAKIQLSK
jgi:formylmethanofuran dehydrogenase subunit E-like metal-binding protein